MKFWTGRGTTTSQAMIEAWRNGGDAEEIWRQALDEITADLNRRYPAGTAADRANRISGGLLFACLEAHMPSPTLALLDDMMIEHFGKPMERLIAGKKRQAAVDRTAMLADGIEDPLDLIKGAMEELRRNLGQIIH